MGTAVQRRGHQHLWEPLSTVWFYLTWGFHSLHSGAMPSVTLDVALAGPGVAWASAATSTVGTGSKLWWYPCDPFTAGVQNA